MVLLLDIMMFLVKVLVLVISFLEIGVILVGLVVMFVLMNVSKVFIMGFLLFFDLMLLISEIKIWLGFMICVFIFVCCVNLGFCVNKFFLNFMVFDLLVLVIVLLNLCMI